VVNDRTPANGALVAGVKEGPEEIIKAGTDNETLSSANNTGNSMGLLAYEPSEVITIMK